MRAILDAYNVTNRFTPSELEVRARRLFRRLGLPEPTCEVVWGKEGEWRLDFHWADLRICVEVDGWSVHALRCRASPRSSQAKPVTIDGNWVLRYDWFDVVKTTSARATSFSRRSVAGRVLGSLEGAITPSLAAKNAQRFSVRRKRRRGMVAASVYSGARARKPGGGAGSSMWVM